MQSKILVLVLCVVVAVYSHQASASPARERNSTTPGATAGHNATLGNKGTVGNNETVENNGTTENNRTMGNNENVEFNENVGGKGKGIFCSIFSKLNFLATWFGCSNQTQPIEVPVDEIAVDVTPQTTLQSSA